MKRILSLLILAISTMTAMAQYQLSADIHYRPLGADDYANERCTLDVYYPETAEAAPVVVWFHGGGLEGGNKYIPQELENSGCVVVAPNYRLMPRATVAQCIDDAAAAVAWAFHHVEEFNGDTAKIYVGGHSAGGYLTDMIGLDKHWLKAYDIDADRIAALFPFSAQKITHFNVRKQQGIGPLQPTIDEYAPISFLRPDCPPMFVITGERELELYGRYEEQAYFWRMLQLHGHRECYLYEMQGFDHGAMVSPAFHILKRYIQAKEEGRAWGR